MVRIAICDDDIRTLEEIYAMVNRYVEAHVDTAFFVRRFHSSYDLLECLENPQRCFHIYLLDIVMPLFNGLDVGRQIRAIDHHAVIIYLTTSGEFALESFSVAPMQYLMKPVTYEKLEPVLQSAMERVHQSVEANVLVRIKDGLYNLRYCQIVYLEYINHTIVFHLVDGQILSSMAIRESFSSYISTYMDDPRFIKPHASYLVNMDHVQSLIGNEFIMVGGTNLPISKRMISQVKRRFIDYITQKGDLAAL